ncbi:cation:proton antiporter [Haloarcula regularis]|uniref:cation:proton antiporter n=1 Tax=Haloarcula regularis TaxID=3033392 RepID=UPI0023E837DA|nr:cation:proton antiporter [Halomicroarcula sp. SYNS111]
MLANRWAFARAGTVDVGISLGLGALLGLAAGFSLLETAFLALVVFNSSTAIVARSVLDFGWIGTPEGDAIFGLVVVEDLVTAGLFGVLSAVVGGGSGWSLAAALLAGLSFLVALTAVSLHGSDVVERAFRPLGSELFVLASLGATAVVGGLGVLTRTSEAVAAFLAGSVFRNAGLLPEAERYLAPVRDVFAVAFFVWVGVRTDPGVVGRVGPFIAVASVVTLGGQVVSGYYAGRAFGLDPDGAVRMGTALTPRGEFSLVIAAFLATAGTTPILTEVIPAFTVGYVLVTSVVGSVLVRQADTLAAVRRRVWA